MRVIYLLFLMTSVSKMLAQTAELGATQGQGAMVVGTRGMLTELKSPERAISGSTYIDDNWLSGKIEFTNGHVLEDILLRYDISLDQIEVKIDGAIKGVKGKNAKSFTVFNSTGQTKDLFVNASSYQEAGVKHIGFFKVIVSGEWSLLEKTSVTLEKPSYNPVLDVGEEEPKYVKSSTFYVAQSNSVIPVSKNKKSFLESLNEESDRVAAFIKQERLSIKKNEDLQRIVDFLNKS